GLIAELTFKLRPRPAKEVTVLAERPFDAILKAAQSVHRARLFPAGIELLSAALAHRIGFRIPSAKVLLLNRFAGIQKTVTYQVEKATKEIRSEAENAKIEIASQDQPLWRNLAAAPLKSDETLIWRAIVRRSRLGEFIKIVADTYRDSFPSILWHAGVADGRMRMIEPLQAPSLDHSPGLTHLRNVAESFGGSLVIESAPDEIKLANGAWGRRGSSNILMKRIKEELDPLGMFSPGRF
ncbi:MAG: FAD-binding oxidoreductase, partial [Pyrinomonadaceae bacterium]